jgi:hypothetical protein
MISPRSFRKRLIYFLGDVRRERCPGGFAWGHYEHLIDYDEALEGIKEARGGYIGLHRTEGELSNHILSTGFMTHAWLFMGEEQKIMEAVSEGVLKRHALHPMMSDFAVILRPRVKSDALIEARERALPMEGCDYDDNFRFDLEREEDIFRDKETALANMRKFGLGVSCTEFVALCYVGHRHELGLYRTRLGRRQVILPDAYLSTHFEVIWASRHTTPGAAHALGLHEEGCDAMEQYWRRQRWA